LRSLVFIFCVTEQVVSGQRTLQACGQIDSVRVEGGERFCSIDVGSGVTSRLRKFALKAVNEVINEVRHHSSFSSSEA